MLLTGRRPGRRQAATGCGRAAARRAVLPGLGGLGGRDAAQGLAVEPPVALVVQVVEGGGSAVGANLAKYTSLYTALAEQYGVRLAEADETIETALATPREAGLLGTDVGLPMLLLSRHSRDAEGGAVEWVRSVYRGSRYKFMATLSCPAG